MDISESFEAQQQPQQQQQQGQQQELQQQQLYHQQQLHQQQMQCDGLSSYGPQPFDARHGPLGAPIPLPAPPQTYDKALSTATSNTSSDIDTDSILLQQFSCLGTRDHEDLINQFYSLMNKQINKDAARFFLEMSNWNLQTAVGCYLDFCNGQTLPSMKIVQQSQPSSHQMAWRLQNTGSDNWPNGCYLMSNSQMRRIEVPTIKPGETCDVIADICTQEPVVWRLCAPHGEFFGESICLVPPGAFRTHEELNNRLAQLIISEPNPADFPQVNIVISEKME